MRHLKDTPFHLNPYFKEVYQAMKTVREELSQSIEKQKRVFFESEPIDFAKHDDRDGIIRDGQYRWELLHNLILLKLGGLKDIKNAVDKIWEIPLYEKEVFKAFTYGKKPPVMLTEAEKREIIQLVNLAESRLRKGIIMNQFSEKLQMKMNKIKKLHKQKRIKESDLQRVQKANKSPGRIETIAEKTNSTFTEDSLSSDNENDSSYDSNEIEDEFLKMKAK